MAGRALGRYTRAVMELVDVARRLSRTVRGLEFAAPVRHVYNPLDYAAEPHERYLRRYGRGRRRAILLGMNPGPWGMAQTGVPFGEISLVRDWLGISGAVRRPADEHPKRPVQGFDCPRSEVSGRRLWGWARERYRTPDRFFATFFVANYCPLMFLEASGRNRTPDRLPAAERAPLLAACDAALRRTVERLAPAIVIGVGAFAEGRARAALAGTEVAVARILHPSPASPAANRGWPEVVTGQLSDLGLL